MSPYTHTKSVLNSVNRDFAFTNCHHWCSYFKPQQCNNNTDRELKCKTKNTSGFYEKWKTLLQVVITVGIKFSVSNSPTSRTCRKASFQFCLSLVRSNRVLDTAFQRNVSSFWGSSLGFPPRPLTPPRSPSQHPVHGICIRRRSADTETC